MIVLDASVAVKWYVAEPSSAEAVAVLAEHESQIYVPDIFVVEVGGALVRRANMDKALRDEAVLAIARFTTLIAAEMVVCQPMRPDDVVRASQIALDLGHPLKDCLYLVLAMTLQCPLVTADARFAARAVEAYRSVRLLGGTG